MLPGQLSETAQYVAFARALGDLAPRVPGFSDPTAERFLPERWHARMARARAELARGHRGSQLPPGIEGMEPITQLRTVALDRAIEAALPLAQLVVLGAGLDGRAWRMPALERTVVFEVDHPATQAWKRARAVGLPRLAREVHFVPVDLARDDLAAHLAAAGHDATQPTFWLWEGVAMYLAPAAVAATLTAMAASSAHGSRAGATYLRPPPSGFSQAPILALLGEPARSTWAPAAWARAAAVAGWSTVSDTGVMELRRELAPALTLAAAGAGPQWDERCWLGQRA